MKTHIFFTCSDLAIQLFEKNIFWIVTQVKQGIIAKFHISSWTVTKKEKKKGMSL